jgi:hypothetical protein
MRFCHWLHVAYNSGLLLLFGKVYRMSIAGLSMMDMSEGWWFCRIRWAQHQSHKKCARTCCVKLVFLHPIWFGGHVACFVASGARNFEGLCFMLGWARCRSHKKCTGTRYTELVVFHLVRFGGHVVCFGASGGPSVGPIRSTLGHVMPNLCVCIPYDLEVT